MSTPQTTGTHHTPFVFSYKVKEIRQKLTRKSSTATTNTIEWIFKLLGKSAQNTIGKHNETPDSDPLQKIDKIPTQCPDTRKMRIVAS
eukprot:6968124-Ditylum_brightwellii.AAC.1